MCNRLVVAMFFCMVLQLSVAKSMSQNTDDIRILPVQQVDQLDILRVPIGSGPNDVGITNPSEANPEGPMSFAISEDGQEVFIPDQVNSRIQVFAGGKRQRSIPIGDIQPKDLELLPHGEIALLTDKNVVIISNHGEIIRSIAVEGRLVPSSEDVTGIYARTKGRWKGLWLNVGDRSVRIASLDQGVVPGERISVPGRISVNGLQLISLRIHGNTNATVYRSKVGSISEWELEFPINLPGKIDSVDCIDDDNNGRLYLAVNLADDNKLSSKLVIVNPEAKKVSSFNLFVQRVPHEIFHSVRISANGNVFQMALEYHSVFIREYKPSTSGGKR